MSDIKAYIDPGGVVMGYKGISKWTAKVNAEMKAKLDAVDYDILSDAEKDSYNHFRECIVIFESGKDPLYEAGYFYAPYIPKNR